MVSYKVTIFINKKVEKEWFKWMCNEHIPEVMDAGLFNDYSVHRIIKTNNSENADKTVSVYEINYICETMRKYEKYAAEHAPALQEKHTKKYKGNFTATRVVTEYEDLTEKAVAASLRR